MAFQPPKSVAASARRGLELRKQFGRGGTPTGVRRAVTLKNRNKISKDVVKRMHSFFSRHEKNKDTPPSEGNGKIAWLLWGGDSGRRWVRGILNKLKDKKGS